MLTYGLDGEKLFGTIKISIFYIVKNVCFLKWLTHGLGQKWKIISSLFLS